MLKNNSAREASHKAVAQKSSNTKTHGCLCYLKRNKTTNKEHPKKKDPRMKGLWQKKYFQKKKTSE
jgi:hypothetical protein